MDRNGLRSVSGQLLYGGPESVDRVARSLVERGDGQMWRTLVETIRSEEELPARIRCLEVLARSAAIGGDTTAEAILTALGGGPGGSEMGEG